MRIQKVNGEDQQRFNNLTLWLWGFRNILFDWQYCLVSACYILEEKGIVIKFGLHTNVYLALKGRYYLNTEALSMWHHWVVGEVVESDSHDNTSLQRFCICRKLKERLCISRNCAENSWLPDFSRARPSWVLSTAVLRDTPLQRDHFKCINV